MRCCPLLNGCKLLHNKTFDRSTCTQHHIYSHSTTTPETRQHPTQLDYPPSPLTRYFYAGIQKSVLPPDYILRLRVGECVLVLYEVHPPVTVNHLQTHRTHRERRKLTGMAPLTLRRLAVGRLRRTLLGFSERPIPIEEQAKRILRYEADDANLHEA